MEQQQRSGLTSTGLKKSAQMVTRTLPAFGPCASMPTSVMPLRPCHQIGRSTRSNASSTNCLHAGALLRAQQAHTFTRQIGRFPACKALRSCHARIGVHATLSKRCLYPIQAWPWALLRAPSPCKACLLWHDGVFAHVF